MLKACRMAAQRLLQQVAEASKRLIQLQRLLGDEDDVDIVWMLVREPG